MASYSTACFIPQPYTHAGAFDVVFGAKGHRVEAVCHERVGCIHDQLLDRSRGRTGGNDI
jgi:hypothetical protein